MRPRRLFRYLIILLLVMTFAINLLPIIQLLRKENKTVVALDPPYSISYKLDETHEGRFEQAFFCDEGAPLEISLFPYAHYNALGDLPLYRGDKLRYRLGKVRYTFQTSASNDPDEVLLSAPSIEFKMDKDWHTLYQEDGKLFEEKTGKYWPFNGRKMICKLPLEPVFYDPIAIAGLDGCAILVLSPADPMEEADITVYLPTKKGWETARFIMPDGTQIDQFKGYVCRHVDPTASYSTDPAMGQMELCQSTDDGSVTYYQVSCSNESLVLSPMDINTKDILVNWRY